MFDSHAIASALLKSWQVWLFVILVGIVIAYILSRLNPPAQPGYRYCRKTSIMTKAEHRLFIQLVEIVAEKYCVFPQVHLDAILDSKSLNGEKWFGAWRHINEKSVDFVICDKANEVPLLAIELDDWSHEREDRKRRDGIVGDIFKSATLPLIRFSPKEAENKELITQKLLAALGPANEKAMDLF